MEIIDIDSRVTINGSQSTTVNGNGPVFIYSKSMVIITGKNSNKLFPSNLQTVDINDKVSIINSNGPTYVYSNGSVTVNGDGYVALLG
jgi:hypothetical protein